MSFRDLYRLYLRIVLPQPWAVRRFIERTAPENGAQTCMEIGSGNAPFEATIRSHWQTQTYLRTDMFPGSRTDIAADATSLPVPDSSIDLIVGFQLIQHVPEASGLLREGARALRTGGYLLLTFPFVYGECDVRDFRRWTIEGMARECEAAGFELIAAERIGGLFFMITSMFVSVISRLFSIRRESWRAADTGSGVVRLAAISILTLPLHALGWIALFVDRILPTPTWYMGGMILVRNMN